MEGGASVAGKAEFKECLRLTWSQPYILRLVFSAGIGGLLFGYDTGMNYVLTRHKIQAHRSLFLLLTC
uniref:Major facilitator superfamily (MFS) profile domain-containing protein n=1 Tax=Aegilops tauschii subsp. strangulata TaxID=200361 RepID=A0A453CJ02_AEGTS